jgi:spore coat protein SA
LILRIALISSEKLPVPPVRGGAIQQYIEGILPYLREKHEITVYCISDLSLKNYEIVDGVTYIRLPARSKDEYFNLVTRLLAEFNYDIVHVFNRPRPIKKYWQSAPDSKYIISVHNEMFASKKISKNDAKECIEQVSAIVTISDFIQRGILKKYPQAEGKIRTIYSGVNLQQYQPVWSPAAQEIRKRIKSEYGINNARIILYVSRFSPKKGSHLVLQAMEEVIKENRQTVLLVVGSKWYGTDRVDDYVSYIYSLAKKIQGHIVFTGFVPPADIHKYYACGDIFVCASQWEEPLARVHYEAMAAGLPVITTNRGGNPEVVKGYRNGLVLSDYDSPEQFAAAINFLLKRPELARELGLNGRCLAEARFGYSRVAEDVLKLYEEM